MKLKQSIWVFALFFGCAAGAAESSATFKASEFTFTRPAGWETVETTSQMRKAQFKVSDANAKEPVEVILFYFGAGNGGGPGEALTTAVEAAGAAGEALNAPCELRLQTGAELSAIDHKFTPQCARLSRCGAGRRCRDIGVVDSAMLHFRLGRRRGPRRRGHAGHGGGHAG